MNNVVSLYQTRWHHWQAIILLPEVGVDEAIDGPILSPKMELLLNTVLDLPVCGFERTPHAG